MQTLPAYQMVRNSSRREQREYATFVQWSVSPQRLPELVVPQFFGPTHTLAQRDYWGGRYESETYDGAAHGWTTLDSPIYDARQAERAFGKLVDLLGR